MHFKTIFAAALLALLVAFTPAAFAQGFFEKEVVTENEDGTNANPVEAKDAELSKGWSKQQFANAIVEATTPLLSVRDIQNPSQLEQAKKLNAEAIKNRTNFFESTFTTEELNALYKFYITPEGRTIAAKYANLQRNQIIQQVSK